MYAHQVIASEILFPDHAMESLATSTSCRNFPSRAWTNAGCKQNAANNHPRRVHKRYTEAGVKLKSPSGRPRADDHWYYHFLEWITSPRCLALDWE